MTELSRPRGEKKRKKEGKEERQKEKEGKNERKEENQKHMGRIHNRFHKNSKDCQQSL